MMGDEPEMIVLYVWDGLRPDMITPELTPFLYEMGHRGVFCRASHAVFPTSTRVNSASLVTGCYPRRHGLVDNALYMPAYDSTRTTQCSNWDAIEAVAHLEERRVLDTPTLGEILKASGKRMASAGSGSEGTIHLTNPTLTGPVVNWATAWPAATREGVTECCGSFPSRDSASADRNRFIIQVALDYLVPVHRPDLLIVWLADPDKTQHECGIGSPTSRAMISTLDVQLREFMDAVTSKCAPEQLTCILLSDHGMSTISERVDPEQDLTAAGLKAACDSGDLILGPNSLYLNGEARGRLDAVVRFLQSKPWVGGLFLRDDILGNYPVVMSQSAVFGSHPRSAELMYTYRWSPDENEYGVPGCVTASSRRNLATHGSASPYNINNCLIAWGKGIKNGVVSSVPCGCVDVAPTVLHLLGLCSPATMDGRVLSEILEGGPHPDELQVSSHTRECVCETDVGKRRQVSSYSSVGSHMYLDQATLSP